MPPSPISQVRWTVLGAVVFLVMLAVTLIFTLGPAALLLKEGLGHHPWQFWALTPIFALTGLTFLATANLFARLARSAPRVYRLLTDGRGFLGYVGWAGAYVLWRLYRAVCRLAEMDEARISPALRGYSAVVCWAYRFLLFYLIVSLVVVTGVEVYAGLVSKNGA